MYYVNTPNGTENITCMKSIKTGITAGLVSSGFPEFLECYLHCSQISNVCGYISRKLCMLVLLFPSDPLPFLSSSVE